MIIFWCSDYLHFVTKLLDSLATPPPPPPLQSSSLRVTWDAASWAWSPKISRRIKHNSQLLGCAFFFLFNLQLPLSLSLSPSLLSVSVSPSLHPPTSLSLPLITGVSWENECSPGRWITCGLTPWPSPIEHKTHSESQDTCSISLHKAPSVWGNISPVKKILS